MDVVILFEWPIAAKGKISGGRRKVWGTHLLLLLLTKSFLAGSVGWISTYTFPHHLQVWLDAHIGLN